MGNPRDNRNRLRQLRDFGLPVNWTTVLVGWIGPGELHPLLTAKDVIDFAVEVLVSDEDSRPEIVQLAGALPSEVEVVQSTLYALASEDAAVRAFEERKWRLVLLQELLVDLTCDPLYGLINFKEFWGQFSYPDDSPYDSRNEPDPTHFFEEDNYRKLIQSHKEWIEAERQRLLLA